ncbi:MAG: tetratricopeptide repeat protein [Planctomycetota bacterium]|jgi:tetratricopeptide (TPR) repeat protein|nr:tetratricopeptide repeat protein [Planctomycetota bacterium]
MPGKILILALFLRAAAGLSPALESGDDAGKYRAYMDEGIGILLEGLRDEDGRAIARFKAALRLRPESAEAYYWIALVYSDQNKYARAADNAKDATIYDDRFADAWLLWGQSLLYQGEWSAALEKLEIAARLDPENPLIQFNLGRVHYHGFNNPDSALPKFRAVWQMSQRLRREHPEAVPLLVQARLYMGYCESDRGRWENAINAFRDVLADAGSNYDAALRLAIAYRNSGRPSECQQILLNLVNVIPMDSPANRRTQAETHLQLADLYLKEIAFRNRELALEHLQAFVRLVGGAHPMLAVAREYLAAFEIKE